MTPEIVTIVDRGNRVVGAVPRPEMRARRLLHRCTYVLVVNSQGEPYVQKRTTTKDVFPGYHDPAAGGVVLAGESYLDGAVRELEEELGIRGVPLEWLFDFYYADPDFLAWGAAFWCRWDGDIVWQAAEVESGRFMTVEALLRLAEREPVTPDGLYVVRRFRAMRAGREADASARAPGERSPGARPP